MALESIYQLLQEDQAASTAYETLRDAGGRVFVVGGALRDALLGKKPKDIDLMVGGLSGDQIVEALTGKGRIDLTGKSFGVYRFKIGKGDVEIALPRAERSIGEGHKDFEVQTNPFLPPEEDLNRRDFTANAMALDLDTGELLDPFGGRKDIENRTLSVVNPKAFHDDPLRIVRAIVAYARHGLMPDEYTLDSMKENADRIRHLPGERVQAELDKLFSSPDPASALEIAYKTGVLDYLVPELATTFGFNQNNPHHDLPVGEHSMAVLRKMTQLSNDPDLRLAAALHDIGKPDSYSENDDPDKIWVDKDGNQRTRGNFYKRMLPDGTFVGQDHEEVGADYAEALMKRLKYPNSRIRRVSQLIRNHMFDYPTSPRQARRLLNKLNDENDPEYGPKMAMDLMKLREADASGKSDGTINPEEQPLIDQSTQNLQDAIDQQDAFGLKNLAINGQDLINLGYKPGPEIGIILNDLLQRVIEDPTLNTRQNLLTMVPPPRT